DPSDMSLLDESDSIGATVMGDVSLKDDMIYAVRLPINDRAFQVFEPSDLSSSDGAALPDRCGGVEWADPWWYIALPSNLVTGDPVRVGRYDESLQLEDEIEAPEMFTGLEIVGTYLYAVGESGVWRRSLI